jgi:hypothetical protein
MSGTTPQTARAGAVAPHRPGHPRAPERPVCETTVETRPAPGSPGLAPRERHRPPPIPGPVGAG